VSFSEALRVQPVFPSKQDAIDYAETRACFRSDQIRVFEFERQRWTHDCVQRSGSKAVNAPKKSGDHRETPKTVIAPNSSLAKFVRW